MVTLLKFDELTARVINAILCRVKFYLYPDLQTIDPGETKKPPEKLPIEPHDFANRCVAALMTLFDYNLSMLKVKKDDKNAGEKIDKIYDIIEKLRHIFLCRHLIAFCEILMVKK